ncbi:MAG: type II secretion system protein [Desulfovibrionaceae bacterium]
MKTSPRGFTLIETIITLVLVGIVGAFIAVMLSQKLTKSPESLIWAEDSAAVEKTMERIIHDYVTAMNASDPSTAVAAVLADQSDYAALEGCQVDMEWVRFDSSGDEVSGSSSDTLKVSVSMLQDSKLRHTLVTLLPQSRISTSDESVNF